MYIFRLIDINQFGEADYLSSLERMSEGRRSRLERLRSEASRRLMAAGDLLARLLASELAGARPEALTVESGENGKPHIKECPVYISISHSGSFAMAAASLRPVGADIERLRPLRPEVARRFCSGEELAYLLSDEALYERRAAALWTMKEAYGKMTGAGVFAPGGFAASFSGGEPVTDYGAYAFYFPQPPEGYAACVCVGGPAS